jgi:hypothetical protein
MKAATSPHQPVRQRVAAMAEAPLAVCSSDANLQAMLDVLRSTSEPIEVRLAALQSLQAASFSVVAFEACRPDYIATLRQVAEDPDPELRQRVLGILMREKDGAAGRKLLEGLRHPDKALVPPEKALQLLSYDVHTDAYALARDIVSNPPNADARREALRLLAADASSAPLFERILQDKSEDAQVRQISAAALRALEPGKLQTHARRIALDDSESDDVRATSLTALTQMGDRDQPADSELMTRVERLSEAPSGNLKQSARRLLAKYKR